MKSPNKTKQELIDEVAVLKQRISELEKDEKYSSQALELSGRGMDRPSPQTKYNPEAVFVVFDRKLEFVSDRFAELFGVSPEEACSSNFDPMTLIAPESRRYIRELYRETCHCAFKTKQIHFTGLSKDGLKIECETFLLFISYKWGIAIQGTLHGISMSERIDRALQRRYSDSPGVLNATSTGALYADKAHAWDFQDAEDEMPMWNFFNAFAHHHSPKPSDERLEHSSGVAITLRIDNEAHVSTEGEKYESVGR
jgi:hypothetical protein